MLRKWKLIASLGLTAAGAAAAGIAVLMQKLPKEASQADGKAAPAKSANGRAGVYSFISGFQDAATVEMRLDYDPDKLSFAIVEDEFLSYTSDSHVAVMYGEDFNLQLEYAGYYGGEDFAAHSKALLEKHPTGGEMVCGELRGVWVLDGDNIAVHLPIPEDRHSYLLITVQKTSDYDDPVTTLPDYAPLKELLSTIRFTRM